MQESNNVQEHVNSFVKITIRLAELGIYLGDPAKVIMLLYSLPRSFQHFVVAIQTRDKLPRFNVVKLKLLDEAEKHNTNKNQTENAEKREYATHTKESKGKNKKKSNGSVNGQRKRIATKSLQCWQCGQTGYNAATVLFADNSYIHSEGRGTERVKWYECAVYKGNAVKLYVGVKVDRKWT